jgi:hypothetical protein
MHLVLGAPIALARSARIAFNKFYATAPAAVSPIPFIAFRLLDS